MRAIFVALALALAVPGMAAADNDVGCGVGTEVWKGNTGLLYKILASSTNGMTFQSISITFGLLNCNGRDTVTADAQLRQFAAANIDALARDAAAGGGESLSALATLLGVSDADRAAFYGLSQANFVELFGDDHVTSGQVLERLDHLLAEDAHLAIYARS